MIRRWSIARRLFAANLLFVVALTAIVGTAVFLDARDHAYEEAGRRMAGIATAVADAPFVLAAADTADPTALLQPYALKIMNDAMSIRPWTKGTVVFCLVSVVHSMSMWGPQRRSKLPGRLAL